QDSSGCPQEYFVAVRASCCDGPAQLPRASFVSERGTFATRLLNDIDGDVLRFEHSAGFHDRSWRKATSLRLKSAISKQWQLFLTFQFSSIRRPFRGRLPRSLSLHHESCVSRIHAE